MIDSSALLSDLKTQLRALQADLQARADDPAHAWGADLKARHDDALRRERTALSWSAWRDNEVDQAAVAWIVATTFVRFCEDNDLLLGATRDGLPVAVGWLAGPGDRSGRARENQTAYYRAHPTHHDRDWLHEAFRVLAAQPAGRALVDPDHNPVWVAEISAEAATGLVNFWRRTDADGTLVHDFTDPDLGTRFLGDLYQDLSEHAKKTYALLQTPVFVEEFILGRTLVPAMDEFGLDGLRLIDPTCGSGHFLLGAFEMLNARWAAEAPAMDAKQRVRRAMDSIHGVDLNPFAVAIARFRLTVAGLRAAGERSLVGVAEMGFHLAIGDSLLGEQGVRDALFGDDDAVAASHTEDLATYTGILEPGRYHVVVGNPPYITVKDKALNKIYREAYKTTAGKYALSVPFMELFCRLARRGEPGRGAGHVGQITSNSFMKREFGKKLITEFFAGFHTDNPVDLTHVIDTSGAYIPGHGTPTVIVIGRRRRPMATHVRAVLGVRGEPGQPARPEHGLVWTEMTTQVDHPGFDGTYVSVTDLGREVLTSFPWSLSGGGASELVVDIESSSVERLTDRLSSDIGFASFPGNDEPFFLGSAWFARHRDSAPIGRALVVGDVVRDWTVRAGEVALAPYDASFLPIDLDYGASWGVHLWRFRATLGSTTGFDGRTRAASGESWWTWYRWVRERYLTALTITFAFVATHNHFVLDRGGKVFNRSAPVIKLPEGATEDQHLELLGVLNSSTACFWLKQVSHNKGSTVDTRGARQTLAPWEDFYEFTGTKLQEFPLPATLPLARGRALDELARALSAASPQQVVTTWRTEPTRALAATLREAHAEWERLRARLIFEQEELDWETYRLYDLTDEDLTYGGRELDRLALGERAFEVLLARKMARHVEESSWFERHGSQPLTEWPAHWPDDYRELATKRFELMQSDRNIGLLERPEHKRRWAVTRWDVQLRDALGAAILDRLEDAELWTDHQGPATRSVAQLATRLRHDDVLLELAREYAGIADPDLAAVIEQLALSEAVPYLAAYRYKSKGLEKFREWQKVWELQRREDAGDQVTIPVPPKYTTPDFARPEYWKARGKLDVPKERFILYPGIGREGDATPVLGWAGWNHRDQAVALVRETLQQQALGVTDDTLVPLVAGLVELEPWLHQWHTDLEPEFGASAADAVTGQIDQLLARLGATRADVTAWLPPAPARGRRPRR